jgi:hypothetical protein
MANTEALVIGRLQYMNISVTGMALKSELDIFGGPTCK